MHLNAFDIEAEHKAALSSLSVAQRRAFERLGLAENRSWREGASLDACLQRTFAVEAAARTVVLANDR